MPYFVTKSKKNKMFQFLQNHDTIEDKDTGIIMLIHTNPIPLQDYYPFEDIFEKDEYDGNEIIAVWVNEDKKVDEKAVRTILKSGLEYYKASQQKK